MGITYLEQLAVARRAEAAGFETLFRSDHYESFPGGSDEPTTDAWAVLAGLARETSTDPPRCARVPGHVPVTGQPRQGRGHRQRHERWAGRDGRRAGWHADEHRRHGFPFPAMAERAEMLEETLEILRGLWSGPDGWSFAGRHFGVEDTRFRPKPSSGRRPMAGGPT